MKAKALRRAARLSPSESAINSSAASVKRSSRSVFTVVSRLIVSREVALMTSFGYGIPIGMNLMPAFLSIFCRSIFYFMVQNVMHVPALPALAVRPERWMYVSTSLGGSTWITRSTLGMSRPREATSVATSTLNLCSLNL